MVKDLRSPSVSACKNHVWQRVPFFLGVRRHRKVGQTVDDIEWEYAPLESPNALMSSYFHGSVVHSGLEVFHLASRMNGSSSSVVGMLL